MLLLVQQLLGWFLKTIIRYHSCDNNSDPDYCMYRWMETYQSGLGTSEAQLQVKQFSSRKYKSHRCILDMVARALDTVQ